MKKKPDQWFITDLSEKEQEEYNRITDYLSQQTELDTNSWGENWSNSCQYLFGRLIKKIKRYCSLKSERGKHNANKEK